jgi:hypothetical protein
MAAQSGTKVNNNRLSRFARAVISAAWAAAALGIFAVALLLPAYAQLLNANYERDCLDAELACAEQLIEAQENMIAAGETDEVLTQRLARSQLGLLPQTERVAIDPANPRPVPPAVFSPQTPAYPPAPPEWIISMGERLVRAPLRRALMLLAAGALFAAMLLYGRPRKLA